MANVSGMRVTNGLNKINQDRRVVDMAENIALLDPNESPFVTILKMAKKNTRKVYNPKFDWLEDDLLGYYTYVATAVSSAAATSLAVDDGSIFRVGDILFVPSVGEYMRVTAVSANTLTVARGYGGSTAAAAIPLDAIVLDIGPAMEEGSANRGAKSTQTVTKHNYTQIFRTPVEISGTLAASKLYGGKEASYQRRKALIEHKRDIANAMYFGRRYEDATGAKVRRTMGGIFGFMADSESHAFSANGTTLTYANFDSYVARKAFAHGSSDKLMICGGNMATVVNSWAEKKLVTQVGKDKTYGVNISNLVTTYGNLNVMYDSALDKAGMTDRALILDMDNIAYVYLDGRDTKLNTNIQAPDVDGETDEYITECSLEFKLPKTHFLVTGAYIPA